MPSRRKGLRPAVMRLLRTGWVRRLGAVTAICTAVLLTSFVTVSAWDLSAEQVATRDFGRFDARVDPVSLPALAPGDERDAQRRQAVTPAGGVMTLSSNEVRPTGRTTEVVDYLETNWSARPFPALTLTSGRWPARPGEVVLAGENLGTTDASMLSVLSGRARFTVVGRADDRFSVDDQILAGPGTWASLPASVAQARQGLAVQTGFYVPAAQVATTQTRLRALGSPSQVATRAEAQAGKGWVLESPFAVLLPSLGVPLLALASTVLIGARRSRRFTTTTTQVGMPRRSARSAVALAYLIAWVAGSVLGCAAGLVLSVAARAVVARFSWQEVGAYPSVMPVLAWIAVGGLIGLAAACVSATATRETSEQAHPTVTTGGRSRWSAVRRWAALLIGCAGVFVMMRATDIGAAMAFGGVVLLVWLLLIPDLLSFIAGRLDRGSPVRRLAARSMDRGAVIGAALTTVLMALPLTTILLLTATGSSARANALADVGPGQVALISREGVAQKAPAEVQRIAAQELGTATPATVGVIEGTVYHVTQGSGLLLALRTPDEVQTVLGTRLTSQQRQSLTDGNILVWRPDGVLERDFVPVTPQVPTTNYQPTSEWQARTGGVLLRSAAAARKWRVTDGALVYSGVQPADARRLADAVSTAGLDPGIVSAHHAPDSILPPRALIASAILLVILLLAASYAATHQQMRALRRQMGRLIAIGARPRFARGVHTIGLSATTALGLIGAALVAAASCMALLLRNPGAQLDPPVSVLAACGLAYATAIAISALTATRRLDAQQARFD